MGGRFSRIASRQSGISFVAIQKLRSKFSTARLTRLEEEICLRSERTCLHTAKKINIWKIYFIFRPSDLWKKFHLIIITQVIESE